MDEKKIIDALERKFENALMIGAGYINTLSNGATPFWRGRLRQSKTVRKTGRLQVEAVTGNSEVSPYLAVQYYQNLRHKGDRLTGYESFSAGFADGSGRGEKSQYNRGYNAQKAVTNKSRARWYERVIKDETMMDQVNTVVSNAFKAST